MMMEMANYSLCVGVCVCVLHPSSLIDGMMFDGVPFFSQLGPKAYETMKRLHYVLHCAERVFMYARTVSVQLLR